MYENSFLPCINRATRVTRKKETCIDNIIMKYDTDKQILSGVIAERVSDHLPIFVIDSAAEIPITTKKVYYTSTPITDVAIVKLKDELSCRDWSPVIDELDADKSYAKFEHIFSNDYNKNFKEVKKLVKVKEIINKWMTGALRKSSKKKQLLYKKFLKTKRVADEVRYKKYAKIFEKAKEQAKKNHYSNLLTQHKNNLKESWNIMKEIISKKKAKYGLPTKISINGVSISEPKLIAENFNDYFSNIGKKLASKVGKASKSYKDFLTFTETEFKFNDLTQHELKDSFNSLKTGKSPGIDKYHVDVVYKLYKELSVPLTHIFSLSLKTGVFPSLLKIAKVIASFKTGDTEDIGNYRPISILSVFSKLLERIVFERLYKFFDKLQLFFSKQFGFRKNSSIDFGIVDLTQSIQKNFEKKKYTLGVFIDFSKAFDTVDHDILINKLFSYGIKNTELKWFQSYLSNRRQCIHYDVGITQYANVTYGVPQGSILGPLLFIIYVNDMYKAVNKLNVIMFADDTNLFISGKNIKEIFKSMNDQLSSINNWFKANKLSLNIDKTHYTFFVSKRQEDDIPLKLPELRINNEIIKRKYHVKFLGVFIDDTLSWKKHINMVEEKMSKNIGVISRARKYLNNAAMKSLYYAFIHPYIVFGNIAWASVNRTKLDKIKKLQNRAIRIITYSDKKASIRPIQTRLKILDVYDINLVAITLFMYRHKTCTLPSACTTYFECTAHHHATRISGNGFFLPIQPRNSNSFCILYRGPKIWNFVISQLHVDLESSMYLIKSKLKDFFLNYPNSSLW